MLICLQSKLLSHLLLWYGIIASRLCGSPTIRAKPTEKGGEDDVFTQGPDLMPLYILKYSCAKKKTGQHTIFCK